MSGQTSMTDEQFRAWMRGHLDRAADHFGLAVHGPHRWGWHLRSIGSAATGPDGPVWLRVGTERDSDLAEPDLADIWTGIPDSTAVRDVPKPDVLASVEWHEPTHHRRIRADVTTLQTGQPCSPTEALRTAIDLPNQWWTRLRHALDTLRATPTTRYASTPAKRGRIATVFGTTVADRIGPINRATAHGDLHWNNVFQPELSIMDWELWGLYPAGHDAATLYLFALCAPDIAARVRELFADQLDTRSGAIAQLGVAARILLRAENGATNDLAGAVETHVATTRLIERATESVESES